MILAPADTASASVASTCARSATLCASAKPENPLPCASTFASLANASHEKRVSTAPPVLKNATSPSTLARDRAPQVILVESHGALEIPYTERNETYSGFHYTLPFFQRCIGYCPEEALCLHRVTSSLFT